MSSSELRLELLLSGHVVLNPQFEACTAATYWLGCILEDFLPHGDRKLRVNGTIKDRMIIHQHCHIRGGIFCPQGPKGKGPLIKLFSCLHVPAEEAQHWLVNRKLADLVKVAFYGLPDSSSMFREPEEDEKGLTFTWGGADSTTDLIWNTVLFFPLWCIMWYRILLSASSADILTHNNRTPLWRFHSSRPLLIQHLHYDTPLAKSSVTIHGSLKRSGCQGP